MAWGHDALKFAPIAPQLARTARSDACVLGDQDCLAVNVWAPPAELPFVFGNLQTPLGLEFTGTAPPTGLARTMNHVWAQFALEGDPGWAQSSVTAPWVQIFDASPRCEIHSESARLRVWAGAPLWCIVLVYQLARFLRSGLQ